jgi:hypothetical protein
MMHQPPGRILDAEVLEERARNLAARGLNGIRLVFVELLPAAAPTEARLDVEFHTVHELANILAAVGGGATPHAIFPISGGVRVRAGAGSGQVRVDQVVAGPTADRLQLRVTPIGDYSTYTLSVNFTHIDPVFADIEFKFRPACFNMNCAEMTRPPAPLPLPAIDYLAKDFDSFKHTLISAMQQRVPDWRPTSEADLDQVLIDLIAADADELSDFQDRTFNEAYLTSARKRVSLARHARLMDYHIHQGNQAATWLALEVSAAVTLPAGFGAWTGSAWQNTDSRIFVTGAAVDCDPLFNELVLYTWGDSVTALEAGSTSADLALPSPLNAANAADAITLRDLLNSNAPHHLLIQEALNPETGTVSGRDPRARQLLQLTGNAEAVFDPMAGVAGQWCVRVHWRDTDRLKRRYCFITHCDLALPVTGVSRFHANLVRITHGRPYRTILRPPGSPLAVANPAAFEYTDEAHYETTPWGVLGTLPHAPLAYHDTAPGGVAPTRSTLAVVVSGFADPWQEQSDLIESQEDHEHFIVETDEYRVSRLRFGNGVNGRALPADAAITCHYQIGDGIDGNVGADVISAFDAGAHPNVIQVWNPFDVTGGRRPEPVAEIIRRVPEAYRARQLRAVTLEDYVRRAEELPGVARASARYAWTGSWRTVRVAIDPQGTTELPEPLRLQIAAHLDAVRLIGEDLEVRPAGFVPLDIFMRLCAHPDYWPEDLRALLDLEFSDGYTADGRRGFFHPDEWSFGQPLHVSQLIGRALSVQGVGRVLLVSIRRLHAISGPSLATITVAPEDVTLPVPDKLEVRSFEIIQVANDPGLLETGRINFEILGGRQ